MQHVKISLQDIYVPTFQRWSEVDVFGFQSEVDVFGFQSDVIGDDLTSSLSVERRSQKTELDLIRSRAHPHNMHLHNMHDTNSSSST